MLSDPGVARAVVAMAPEPPYRGTAGCRCWVSAGHSGAGQGSRSSLCSCCQTLRVENRSWGTLQGCSAGGCRAHGCAMGIMRLDPCHDLHPVTSPSAATSLPQPPLLGCSARWPCSRSCPLQPGPRMENGDPPEPELAAVPVPGRKWALEAQVRAQLSFLPVLLQVRVARGGTEPGRHFSSSEGHAPAGDDKWGHPWPAQPGDP